MCVKIFLAIAFVLPSICKAYMICPNCIAHPTLRRQQIFSFSFLRKRFETSILESKQGDGNRISKGFGDSSRTVLQKRQKKKNKNNKTNTDHPAKELSTKRKILYVPDESIEIQNFVSFLHEEECEGIDATCIGTCLQTGVRGLYSRETFQAGDYILAIPMVTGIEIMDSTTKVISDVERGLAYIKRFYHHHNKPSSDFDRWGRYLICLPTMEEHFESTPDFWDVETLRELQIPTLEQEAADRQSEIQSLALQHSIDPTELQFATWLVRTRMFTIVKQIPPIMMALETAKDEESEGQATCNDNVLKRTETDNAQERFLQRTFFIPYMDMINHANSNNSNAMIQVIEGTNDEESMYCLQATKAIQKGQEITITYGSGQETTLDIFSKYGFFVSNDNYNTNEYNHSFLDEVDLPMNCNDGQVSRMWMNDNDVKKMVWNDLTTPWLTSMEEDLAVLLSRNDDGSINENMKKAVSLRLYLKKLQQFSTISGNIELEN